MPSKIEDLTGKQFNLLTVIKPVWHKNNKTGKVKMAWECKCDCGNTTISYSHYLRVGRHKSCGCKARNKLIDLTGKKFGRLTALTYIRTTKKSGKSVIKWICKCDCGSGKLTEVIANSLLKTGGTKSCGCIRSELLRKNSTGESNWNWKGGKRINPYGYVEIKSGEYKGKFEHRILYEQHYGVKLKRHQTVHHKNGIRDDNRIENLELWDTHQPYGQRITDKLEHYFDMVREYSTNPQFREYIQTQLKSLPDSLNSNTNKKSLNKNINTE